MLVKHRNGSDAAGSTSNRRIANLRGIHQATHYTNRE
jgi:hypothetical protein